MKERKNLIAQERTLGKTLLGINFICASVATSAAGFRSRVVGIFFLYPNFTFT